MNVLALIATDSVNGPFRGLVQLIEGTKHSNVRFVLGLFLKKPAVTTQAIEEAAHRGFRVVTLLQRRRYDPWLICQTLRAVRQNKVTLLQSHGYKSALLSWFLKRLAGVPLIAFAH